MFWNKKKKTVPFEKTEKNELEGDLENNLQDNFNGDLSEYLEKSCEKLVQEPDREANGDFDQESDESFDGKTDDENLDEAATDIEECNEASITVKASSIDSLAAFVFARAQGNLQFMRKQTKEVFELRESHFRIAEVWGTVSMSRECSETEYAKIMLAMELMESPDEFYVLPVLTESDVKKAILEFCEDKYNSNGKKYSNNISKFAKFVEINGDFDDWEQFIKDKNYSKISDFCDQNGITFDGEDGALADGEKDMFVDSEKLSEAENQSFFDEEQKNE